MRYKLEKVIGGKRYEWGPVGYTRGRGSRYNYKEEARYRGRQAAQRSGILPKTVEVRDGS